MHHFLRYAAWDFLAENFGHLDSDELFEFGKNFFESQNFLGLIPGLMSPENSENDHKVEILYGENELENFDFGKFSKIFEGLGEKIGNSLNSTDSPLDFLKILTNFGDLGNLGNFANLGILGNIGDIGNLKDLKNLGDLANLGDIGNLGNLGNLGILESIANIGSLDNIGDLGNIGD